LLGRGGADGPEATPPSGSTAGGPVDHEPKERP
jgi:hypothetical protein